MYVCVCVGGSELRQEGQVSEYNFHILKAMRKEMIGKMKINLIFKIERKQKKKWKNISDITF